MVKKVRSALKDAKVAKKVGNAATNLQIASTRHITRHLKKRAKRAAEVKRFIIGWLMLVVLVGAATIFSFLQLWSSSLVATPGDGGVYIEGIAGKLNNLNPLFSNGQVDDSAGKLIFNGLLKYDESGRLINDLAQQWEVDKSQQKYTVRLRDNVFWHDGEHLTSDDVIYTIEAIQDPQSRSNLRANWLDVEAKKIDSKTVLFTLATPFTPFVNTLTTPILPSHLLKDIDTSRLRTASFNNQPIGTGPFVLQTIRGDNDSNPRIEFTSNKQYHHGEPRIDRFTLRLYESNDDLIKALRSREITAAPGITQSDVQDLQSDKTIRTGSMPINSGVFAFFKTTAPILKDSQVRHALVNAVDRQAILEIFDSQYTPLKTPLLPAQIGYTDKYAQKTDINRSKKLLEQAGWRHSGNEQLRYKQGKELKLSLVTVKNPEYKLLAERLQKQWSLVGVTVDISLLSPEELQRTALTANSYDILLYGISIGRDPDVYVYWHSSQAKTGGRNFSQWQSAVADTALEVGRARTQQVLREARYDTFQSEWQKAAPAVALYQMRSKYAYHQNAHGFVGSSANSIADRLTNVENWTVNTHLVQRTP